MTRSKRLGALVLAVAATVGLGAGGYGLAATESVQLTSSGPQPQVVKVEWGDTVVFQNADSEPVAIVSGHSDFASSAIPPGGTYQKVFDGKVGKYPYRATKAKEKGGTTATHGTVEVTMSAQLTLAAKPAAAVYGHPVTLGGLTTLTEHPVSIEQKIGTAQTAEWKEITQVTPGSDGAFSFAVTPTEKAVYRATQAGEQLRTPAVTVSVAPVVSMTISPRSATVGASVTAKVYVKPATASTGVVIEQSAGNGRWKGIAKGKVAKNGVAKVAFRVAAGTALLRATVKPPVLRPLFVPASSRAVRLLGSNPLTTVQFQIIATETGGAHQRHAGPDRFSTHLLRAKSGRVTLVMKNHGRGKYGLALSGPRVSLKGPIVAVSGVSTVTATLKPGRYVFSSYGPGGQAKGETGRLVVD